MATAEVPDRLWDRLSPGERGSLVRAWLRFAKLYVQTIDIKEPRTLSDARYNADDLQELAKARRQYVEGLNWRWTSSVVFKHGDVPFNPTFPPGTFANGADIDHVLWEMHPSNLFDSFDPRRG